MMGYTTARDHYFKLMKNGVELCREFINDVYPYSNAFCVTNIEMQPGDQIHIEGHGDFRAPWCGFSGFQIKAL